MKTKASSGQVAIVEKEGRENNFSFETLFKKIKILKDMLTKQKDIMRFM